jgi:hypothetical protein
MAGGIDIEERADRPFALAVIGVGLMVLTVGDMLLSGHFYREHVIFFLVGAAIAGLFLFDGMFFHNSIDEARRYHAPKQPGLSDGETWGYSMYGRVFSDKHGVHDVNPSGGTVDMDAHGNLVVGAAMGLTMDGQPVVFDETGWFKDSSGNWYSRQWFEQD